MSIAYPPDPEQSIYSLELLHKVQTIGYRQQDGLAEIERMMSAEPSMLLVDIRYKPQSSNLNWTKQAFTRKYQDRYIWIKELGNVNYQQHDNIQIADEQRGIERLISLLQEHNVLLMCGCESYEACHRKVVYDMLQETLLKAESVKATCFYVDDIQIYPNTPLKYKQWCHLATNGTIEDLHAFAESIGLKRESFQEKETHPHYDLTPAKRTAAIKRGAIATSTIELINICHPRLAEIGARVAEKIAEEVEATCFSELPTPASAGDPDQLTNPQLAQLTAPANPHKMPRTTRLLQQRVEELEHTIEIMHASRIYQEIHPDYTFVDLQAENIRQREQIADILANAERILAEKTEQQQIAARIVLEQEAELQSLRAYDAHQIATIAKAQRIISKLWQYRRQVREARTIPLTSFQREQERRIKAEQRIKQLRSSPFKPTERLIIDELQFQLDNPNARQDAEGYTSLCLETIGKHINMSASTAGRGIEAVQKQWSGMPVKSKKVPERATDGRQIDRLYIKPETPNLIAAALTANLTGSKVQQGGDRYTCAKCGGKHITRHIIKKILLVCDDCGHIIPESEETVSIEYPNASYTKQDAVQRKAKPHAHNLQANIITSDPPAACADDDNQIATNRLESAAKLLRAIAGQHDRHIVMPRNHERKYLEVKSELTIQDLIDHLKGGEARGAPCIYPDDKTRSLSWDEDNEEGWKRLKRAAAILAECGYRALLEKSPHRGGHLWIIFDALVSASKAREAAYQTVPELREVKEYWPAPPNAEKWNRVRLPGAKYHKGNVEAWCKLQNVLTKKIAEDGESAAALLLDSLTPAAIVPTDIEIPAEQDDQQLTPLSIETLSKKRVTDREEHFLEIERRLGYNVPRVDKKWEACYGPIEKTTCYFAVMPNLAAEYYNRDHSLEAIHPKENNGLALSPNGNERSASTSYYLGSDGQERYTDHSQHGMRSDGTKDTGDALELASKVQETSKPELFRMSAGQIVKKATAEMEAAGKNGQRLPNWLESPICIITPAGRERYQWLLGQAKQTSAQEQPAPANIEKPAPVSAPVPKEVIIAELQKAIEQSARTTPPPAPEAPEMQKIGTCTFCGSTRWWPNAEEEYICANVKCLSPIAWTRRAEARQKLEVFHTHENV